MNQFNKQNPSPQGNLVNNFSLLQEQKESKEAITTKKVKIANNLSLRIKMPICLKKNP